MPARVLLRSTTILAAIGALAMNAGFAIRLYIHQRLPTSASRPPAADGFDWRAYLANYPDLVFQPGGLPFTAEAAAAHYEGAGRAAGRVAQPLDLRLRYMTAYGLANQLLAILTGLMIAQEVGAGVVLHPAWARSAFDGNASWELAPIESLLDVEAMAAWWSPRGLMIFKAGAGWACGTAGAWRLMRPRWLVLPAGSVGANSCGCVLCPAPAPLTTGHSAAVPAATPHRPGPCGRLHCRAAEDRPSLPPLWPRRGLLLHRPAPAGDKPARRCRPHAARRPRQGRGLPPCQRQPACLHPPGHLQHHAAGQAGQVRLW